MLAISSLAGSARAEEPRPRGVATAPFTNRLARESSPYLLQHAHNPVDWFPWCPEAFAKAKREGKLVFLSVGYSSCHWCHVMERESFENADVARLLNDWFVAIKVDREERPDIDNVYMTALHVQGQRGGWPLSMFLTADGKPIVGGTYWPPDDRQVEGQTARGFKTILGLLHQWQTERPEELQKQAERLASATRMALADHGRAVVGNDLKRTLVSAVVDGIKEEFDPEFGGFGSAARHFRGPKFPVPCYLELLLDEAERTHAPDTLSLVTRTLDHMAGGGIYDQLGGGFHRYSTERTWTVPHYEKMLYDNAQLVSVYARAYQLTHNETYRRIVRETLAFIAREMTSPEGAFYAALDADSDGHEGLYYVWTPRQLEEALPDPNDVRMVRAVYGLEGPPNFEEKAHILTLPKPPQVATELKWSPEQLASRLKSVRRKLLDTRERRVRPFLDTKVLTGWNGQMIAGYANAGRMTGEPAFIATAARAADFVLSHLRAPDGRLLRCYGARSGQPGEGRIQAYQDDYAFFVDGLLALYDASGERRWLEQAQALTERMLADFGDEKNGGFYSTTLDHEPLFARSKDQADSAQPAGNSIAARNLVRLWSRTGDTRYRDQAVKTFQAFVAPLRANPTSLTALAGALALYLNLEEGGGVHQALKPAEPAQAEPGRKSDAVVKVSARAVPEKPDADGRQAVTVTLTMDPGWHVYANPPGSEELASVQTTVSISGKAKPQEVKIAYPEGEPINDTVLGKYRVYEGSIDIKASVRRGPGDDGPLEVRVKFQACNDKQCLLPATVKVTVP
jgi:uncharacterized protein YyaL (SSP411 family)